MKNESKYINLIKLPSSVRNKREKVQEKVARESEYENKERK